MQKRELSIIFETFACGSFDLSQIKENKMEGFLFSKHIIQNERINENKKSEYFD